MTRLCIPGGLAQPSKTCWSGRRSRASPKILPTSVVSGVRHRRGNRSVRWYAAHRLAELAFHAWDFQVSTGQTPTLDEQVALLLLPTLLESNVPRTYAAGLSTERGAGERYAAKNSFVLKAELGKSAASHDH